MSLPRTTTSQSHTTNNHPWVEITISSTDLVAAAGVVGSLAIAFLLKKVVSLGQTVRQLSKPTLLLPKEMARARELLAQLAILVGADRCVLGVFHNGSLSEWGYHLSKLEMVAGYCAPGIMPTPEMYRVVPIDAIPELRTLWVSERGEVTVSISDEAMSEGCKKFMSFRNIKCLRNVILKAGPQVEVGVLTFHFCEAKACPLGDIYDRADVQMLIHEVEKLCCLRSSHPSVFGALHLQR